MKGLEVNLRRIRGGKQSLYGCARLSMVDSTSIYVDKKRKEHVVTARTLMLEIFEHGSRNLLQTNCCAFSSDVLDFLDLQMPSRFRSGTNSTQNSKLYSKPLSYLDPKSM